MTQTLDGRPQRVPNARTSATDRDVTNALARVINVELSAGVRAVLDEAARTSPDDLAMAVAELKVTHPDANDVLLSGLVDWLIRRVDWPELAARITPTAAADGVRPT